MKKGLSGRLALDSSSLLELVYSTPLGLRLKEALYQEDVEAYTSELGVAEVRYVLCRKIGWIQSEARAEKLFSSGYIAVEDCASLIRDASAYKCSRALSLADCFTLALAKKTVGKAVFARKEQELANEMEKLPFDVSIVFLEDF